MSSKTNERTRPSWLWPEGEGKWFAGICVWAAVSGAVGLPGELFLGPTCYILGWRSGMQFERDRPPLTRERPYT